MLGNQELKERSHVKVISQCQICSSTQLRGILELGDHPAVVFLSKGEIDSRRDASYPLGIQYCVNCGLVQSRYIVDPEILFGGEYHHISGIPVSFRQHLEELALLLTQRFHLSPKDLVVEIGSSDGALLEKLTPYGMQLLGVDPSSVAKIAIDKGIPTLNEFFGEDVSKSIAHKFGKARMVIALNTFAHVESLSSLMNGINEIMDENGIFVTESHYLLDLVQKLQYDFIYHEHLRYYSLRSLLTLFEKYKMDVFDAQRIPTHSGSIRVFACRKGAYPASASVQTLLAQEKEAGLDSFRTFEEFSRRTQHHKEALMNMLNTIKRDGNRIVGLTFPARALTLMQYCGIDANILDYVTEKSPLKVGKYAPGSHIPIVDESNLFNNQPDYGLLLSWHLADEIIPKFKAGGYKGKFIVPLPEPRVIN